MEIIMTESRPIWWVADLVVLVEIGAGGVEVVRHVGQAIGIPAPLAQRGGRDGGVLLVVWRPAAARRWRARKAGVVNGDGRCVDGEEL